MITGLICKHKTTIGDSWTYDKQNKQYVKNVYTIHCYKCLKTLKKIILNKL